MYCVSCIAWIMVDHSREVPGERSSFMEDRICRIYRTEVLQWMFLKFRVSSLCSVLPPLPLHRNGHFLFLYFLFLLNCIILFYLSPFHSCYVSPTMYLNTHHIIVETYHYIPNFYKCLSSKKRSICVLYKFVFMIVLQFNNFYLQTENM